MTATETSTVNPCVRVVEKSYVRIFGVPEAQVVEAFSDVATSWRMDGIPLSLEVHTEKEGWFHVTMRPKRTVSEDERRELLVALRDELTAFIRG